MLYREINPQETIRQLGGINCLKAMVGAYNFFTFDEKTGVQFRFKGSKKANYVGIKLRSDDTYEVTFKKIWGTKVRTVEQYHGVYCDQLIELFENTTDLFLHF